MIKKFIVFIISISIIATSISPALAQSNELEIRNFEKAKVLKVLEIFLGSNGDFNLEGTANREQGAVMVVRLIGKVNEVNSKTYEHPFNDVPDWASNYVGYLYQNGLTHGINSEEFGSKNPLTADQYYTYILRSLGYKDSEGDFKWDNAVGYSKEIGMIDQEQNNYLILKGVFLRDDIVYGTYAGLLTNIKGSNEEVLADKLFEQGSFTASQYDYFNQASKEIVITDAIEQERTPIVVPTDNKIESFDELEEYLYYKMSLRENGFEIDMNSYYNKDILATDFENTFYKVIDMIVADNIGFTPNGFAYSGSYASLQVEFTYADRAIIDKVIKNKAELIKYLYSQMLIYNNDFHISYTEYNGDLFADFNSANTEATSMVEENEGMILISAYEISGSDIDTKVTLKYDYTQEEFEYVKAKAKEVYEELISPDMTNYDKIKVIHDYVVNNMEYDILNFDANTVPRSSYTAYGSFALGIGVCESYTEAINVLLHEAEIECLVAIGDAGGPHAWNIVDLDGEYYHLDATWDDPVMSNGSQTLSHDYFLITDEKITEDHVWDKAIYPETGSER